VIVAKTGKAVLAPVIGARTGLIMIEIVPGIAVLTVILADCAPLPFAEVWPPLLLRRPLLARLVETQLLRSFGALEYRFVRHRQLLLTRN
jgi:hypothetical protein